MKLRLGFLAIFAVITVVVSTATVTAEGGTRYRGGSHARGYGIRGGSGGMLVGVPGIQVNPLTQSQKEQIARIRRDTRMCVRSIRLDNRLTASEKERKVQQAREEGHQRVMSVLTTKQRQEFREWWNSRPGSRMGMGSHGMRSMGSTRMSGTRPGSMHGSGRAGNDPPSASAGKPIFQSNRVVCHGADGTKIAGWQSKVRKMSVTQVQQTMVCTIGAPMLW